MAFIRKRSIRHVLLILILIFSDFFVKNIFLSNSNLTLSALNSFLNFELHLNHGAIFGLFSKEHPLIRVVMLSTLGAVLLTVYVVLQNFLNSESRALRLGMTFMISGVLGNVIDRLKVGAVVDYVSLHFYKLTLPYFNLADVYQLVGYLFIVWALLYDKDIYWSKDSASKRKYWILPEFQKSVMYRVLFFSFCGILFSMLFSILYFRLTLEEISQLSDAKKSDIISNFFFSLLFIYLFLTSIILASAKIYSHRIAAPVYLFELNLKKILKLNQLPVASRRGDEFPELEKMTQKIALHVEQAQQTHNRSESIRQPS